MLCQFVETKYLMFHEGAVMAVNILEIKHG